MFSVTFQTGTESRTTEHTIEVVIDGEKYAVKTSAKILRHTNPRVVGRVMKPVLIRRYKTERGATKCANDLLDTYQDRMIK